MTITINLTISISVSISRKLFAMTKERIQTISELFLKISVIATESPARPSNQVPTSWDNTYVYYGVQDNFK